MNPLKAVYSVLFEKNILAELDKEHTESCMKIREMEGCREGVPRCSKCPICALAVPCQNNSLELAEKWLKERGI
jgi:hypothetical protein